MDTSATARSFLSLVRTIHVLVKATTRIQWPQRPLRATILSDRPSIQSPILRLSMPMSPFYAVRRALLPVTDPEASGIRWHPECRLCSTATESGQVRQLPVLGAIARGVSAPGNTAPEVRWQALLIEAAAQFSLNHLTTTGAT